MSWRKILIRVLSATCDANISFADMSQLLDKLGFYEIIIYWSNEDKAFIAEVPELPGCMADGITYREALSNVEVVIREWIETAKELGRLIPELKGYRLVFA